MDKLDLVEREAVKDAIGFMNLHFLGHGENKSLLDSINEVPTIDAVSVVRCKDCKHWVGDDDVGYCDNPDGLDNYARPNDFCSYGERKSE